jgi:glucan phosphorylase
MYPERFQNKTNGITPRRWLLLSNPALADVLCERIGDGWVTELTQLTQLKQFVDNKQFIESVRRVKQVCVLYFHFVVAKQLCHHCFFRKIRCAQHNG